MDEHPNKPSKYTLEKLDDRNISATISRIGSNWNSFFPNDPSTILFLTNVLKGSIWKIENSDCNLLIFPSWPLWELAWAYSDCHRSLRRTKEIGVRERFGASVGSIVILFFKEFLWLVLYAVLIGVPLVYFSMNP